MLFYYIIMLFCFCFSPSLYDRYHKVADESYIEEPLFHTPRKLEETQTLKVVAAKILAKLLYVK